MAVTRDGERWYRQEDNGDLVVSTAWISWAVDLDAAVAGDGVLIVHHSALNHGVSTEAPEAGDYRVVKIDRGTVTCVLPERWTGCPTCRPRTGRLYRNLDPFGPAPRWAS